MPRDELHLQRWQWRAGKGRCLVVLTILDTGAGLQGLMMGGESPHIGGVVLAVPRLSMTGNGWSADIYSTPVPYHKDCEIAQPVAEALARMFHHPVVVTADIHSDDLTAEELAVIRQACQELTDKACQCLALTRDN